MLLFDGSDLAEAVRRKEKAQELAALYDYEMPSDTFLPRELMKLLASYSCQLNREIAIYITRGGEIVDVSVGTDTDVELRDLRSDQLAQPARLELEGPLSAAALHGYSLSGSAGDYFYRYEDGSLRMPYLDSRSGQCRCAIPDLTLLSDGVGCGELALRANELLTASAWEREKAAALGAAGIGALWCENKTLYHTALPCGLELTDPSYAERQLP